MLGASLTGKPNVPTHSPHWGSNQHVIPSAQISVVPLTVQLRMGALSLGPLRGWDCLQTVWEWQSVGVGTEYSAGQRVGDTDGRILLVSINTYAPLAHPPAKCWAWACCPALIHQGALPTC